MRYNHFDMLPERAFLKVGGRITLEGGGGGGQPSQPTQQTVTQTNIPDWLRDPTQRMVARGETLSEQPYQTYTGQRTAGFTPFQQQAFSQVGNLSAPEEYAQAARALSGAQQFGAAGALGAMGYQPTQYNQYQMRGPQAIGSQEVMGTGYQAVGAAAAPRVFGTSYDAAQAGYAPQLSGTGYQAMGAQAAPDVTGTGYQAAQTGYAPMLQGTSYQAQGVEAAPDVRAADLEYFQMADPGEFTSETAAKYMSPHQQAVTDIAKREAVGEAALLNRDLGARAAKIGAFGGSRFGIEQALLGSKLAQNLSDIEVRGQQSAFENAQQQMERDRAAKLNVASQNLQAKLGVQGLGSGQSLQASLANQQMRQQSNMASQAAYNQALQFGATQEQAAQAANQAAIQAANFANQQATNQAGQFSAGQTQAANLSNQQMRQQAGLASQQAYNQALQFGASQEQAAQLANQAGIQAINLANQGALNQAGQFTATQGMTAQQLNQATQQQANLASQQAYNQAMQFGATQEQAAQVANQQAALTASQANQQMQYQTGLQNLQALLSTQQQQDASRQAAANLNLQGAQFGAQTGLQAGTQLANLGTTSQQQELNRIQALAAAGEQQQALTQQQLNQRYQDFLEQRDWEKNQLGFMSGLIRGTPFSTSTTTSGYSTAPSTQSQLLSGALGVAGLASLLKKEGGKIDKNEGLSEKDKRKMRGEGLAKMNVYKMTGGA